jgi:hypothetical protein
MTASRAEVLSLTVAEADEVEVATESPVASAIESNVR